MNNLNSVLVEGVLVADPKLNYNAKKRPVCEFTINSERYFKDSSEGGMIEDSSNFDVVCWGELAEVCAGQLHKGKGVRVVGRLQEYKQLMECDQLESKIHIIAEHLEFKPKGCKD